MELTTLNALSPLDGRYQSKLDGLRPYFSEYALIRHRVLVEVAWLKTLAAAPQLGEVAPFSATTLEELDAAIAGFGEEEASQVKAIEARTNHDVKAMEYWLKERFAANAGSHGGASEFIHFACTSEDINNLVARADAARRARAACCCRRWTQIIAQADANWRTSWPTPPMLARTHGQPATPTTLGKEMANVVLPPAARTRNDSPQSNPAARSTARWATTTPISSAYPDVRLGRLSQRSFVEGLGLDFNPYTIQIEPHDAHGRAVRRHARASTPS